MKKIALSMLLLVCLWPLQADTSILANSTFANGNANWQGDAKDIESGDLGSMDSNTPGVIVNLKKDKWTRMYQLFTVRQDKLYYTVTFQLSNDFKLNSQTFGDYSRPDLGNVPGLDFVGELPENSFSMLIRGGDNYSRSILNPDLNKLGKSQTLTGRINMFTKGVESCFLLVFPPGEGSITLTTVSLSTTDPNAQP